MKRLICIVAILAMVMFSSLAMALNPNDCPDWFGPQWQCNGRVELSDMGHFDGDTFIWDGPLAAGIQGWGSGSEDLTPTREFQINKGWLQIRNYATPNPAKVQTRVTATAGTKIFIPVMWSVTCIDSNMCPGNQEAFFSDVSVPPEGCNSQDSPYMDYNQCIADFPQYAQTSDNCAGDEQFCRYEADGTPTCADFSSEGELLCGYPDNEWNCLVGDNAGHGPKCFEPVFWNKTDPTMNADQGVDPCCKMFTTRFEEASLEPVDPTGVTVRWVEKNLIAQQYAMPYTGKFPKYELYPMNFWNWPAVGQGWDSNTDYLCDFFVLPDSTGLQHFEFMINGEVKATSAYDVTTLAPMPTVKATKEVEGETKFTMNAKQIKGGLKITWDDPPFKDIQKPGIQLRVYVGAATTGYERFFFIDCPAQISKMLIPMDQWQELKDALIAEGFTEASIGIIYRTMATDFMNRGHSDPIIIPLQ